ncbi:uncharacterized protein LOC112517819 [Cynara cardunculus var. scolymus]|uniref:Uncharacterized protein n=1 Tax=Cynara cardunculus var. scolymus TaxID=59895 RepID=A0A103YGU7_CYNCS|nr:uncharacterized protein LOC112517819 [Cynara cardunculus var. scolymus]KVI08847.1 Protein of unknown function DUF4228 [Cynara cardunculus var. scolymus]
MGNYVSCTLTKHSKGTKVIYLNGEIRRVQQPIKAAELMLESPNTFLVNSKSLRIGARFSALNADEDLEIASVYVMFPMNRLNTVVATADLGALFLAVKSGAKKIGNVRIQPENAPTPPRLSLENIEELSSPEFKHMISMCRSKKPLLETIAEEPISSR